MNRFVKFNHENNKLSGSNYLSVNFSAYSDYEDFEFAEKMSK